MFFGNKTAMEKLIKASGSISEFLMELMRIESTTKQEGALAVAIKEYLKTKGWNIIVQPMPGEPNRSNILATRLHYDEGGPRLLFNTHLDTVPPYLPPSTDGKNIYGRGSNDAKGQIASMIFAIQKIAEKYPEYAEDIGLLLVVGEETDHVGMKEANKLNLKPEFLIVGEPTEMKFAHAQKGAVKVKFESNGIAAHSGYPHMGDSAVHKLIDVLHDLLKHKWPSSPELGETTINVGLINGGQAVNALAEKATASIAIRNTYPAKEVLETVKKIVNKRVEIVDVGMNDPVILTKPPQPYESWPVAFNTDIPYFDYRNHLKGCFLFGPGSITNAHSKSEFISIEELEKAVDVHVDLALKLLRK